jgi:hypothetical protein
LIFRTIKNIFTSWHYPCKIYVYVDYISFGRKVHYSVFVASCSKFRTNQAWGGGGSVISTTHMASKLFVTPPHDRDEHLFPNVQASSLSSLLADKTMHAARSSRRSPAGTWTSGDINSVKSKTIGD